MKKLPKVPKLLVGNCWHVSVITKDGDELASSLAVAKDPAAAVDVAMPKLAPKLLRERPETAALPFFMVACDPCLKVSDSAHLPGVVFQVRNALVLATQGGNDGEG